MSDQAEHTLTLDVEKIKAEDTDAGRGPAGGEAKSDDGREMLMEVNGKGEPNDSEAETEILSGSRLQTPRKPSAMDVEGAHVQKEAPSLSPGRDGTSSPLTSPKKRKVEELGPEGKTTNGVSSDEEEDDIVVRRTRIKRARKANQGEGGGSSADDGSAATMVDAKKRASKSRERAVQGNTPPAAPGGNLHANKRTKSSTLSLAAALDLSTSPSTSPSTSLDTLGVAQKVGEAVAESPMAEMVPLQSPRLRSRFHRRSISHHPSAGSPAAPGISSASAAAAAAVNGVSQDTRRMAGTRTTRGSEGPPPSVSASTPGERSSSQQPSAPPVPPNVRVDAYGCTPLHKACKSGDEAKVRQILSSPEGRAAQLTHPDYAGNTPLHFAALKGDAGIIRLLLEHNVDVNVVNYQGDTPLQDATDNDHDDVVEILQRAGGVIAVSKPAADTIPRHSALYGDLTLKNLIKAIKDRDGNKAQAILNGGVEPNQDCVVAAIEANNLDMLEVLPACGAPIDEVDDGKTPLVRAIELGKNQATSMLLSAGADAMRHYPEGSDLHYWDLAKESNRKGWQEVCRMLRRAAGLGPEENHVDQIETGNAVVDEMQTNDNMDPGTGDEETARGDLTISKENSPYEPAGPELTKATDNKPSEPNKNEHTEQIPSDSVNVPVHAALARPSLEEEPPTMEPKGSTSPDNGQLPKSPIAPTKLLDPVIIASDKLHDLATPYIQQASETDASTKSLDETVVSVRRSHSPLGKAESPVRGEEPPSRKAQSPADEPTTFMKEVRSPPDAPASPQVGTTPSTTDPIPRQIQAPSSLAQSIPTPPAQPSPQAVMDEATALDHKTTSATHEPLFPPTRLARPPDEPTLPLPVGLTHILEKPLRMRKSNTPDHHITLDDGFNTFCYTPLKSIQPDCPLEHAEERWCPGYQASAVLGHSSLRQVKTLVENLRATATSSSAGDNPSLSGSPALTDPPHTIPLSEHWRRTLWVNLGLWQTFARRYKYERFRGTKREAAAFANQDGFEDYVVKTHGPRLEYAVISWGPTLSREQNKWMELEDGTQAFWIRLEDAKMIVEAERGSQKRLEDLKLFETRLIGAPGENWKGSWSMPT